jgi:hypothetical protein
MRCPCWQTSPSGRCLRHAAFQGRRHRAGAKQDLAGMSESGAIALHYCLSKNSGVTADTSGASSPFRIRVDRNPCAHRLGTADRPAEEAGVSLWRHQGSSVVPTAWDNRSGAIEIRGGRRPHTQPDRVRPRPVCRRGSRKDQAGAPRRHGGRIRRCGKGAAVSEPLVGIVGGLSDPRRTLRLGVAATVSEDSQRKDQSISDIICFPSSRALPRGFR